MSDSLTHTLFTNYAQVRQLTLSEEQFSSFMAFYPALLVAASDGIVDREEWAYCKKLAAGLGASFCNDGDVEEANFLTQTYRDEFRFLINHLQEWKEPFLEALKEYFSANSYAKTFVSETLYLFADASNGISQEEMDLINQLETSLELK